MKLTKDAVKEWTLLTLSTLLMALGIYCFKFPNNFSSAV